MTNWYTNKEQSIALSEFLPRDSANLYYPVSYNSKGGITGTEDTPIVNKDSYIEPEAIPCWSVEALLRVLPPIASTKPQVVLYPPCITYYGNFVEIGYILLEACYKTIIKLHQENYI